MSYVGYTSIPTAADDQGLRQLLDLYTQPGDFFFLRSLHQVSGIITELPVELSPEGQLFNHTLELRWKKRRQGYDILWLGLHPPADVKAFTAIERQWQTADRPALLHDRRTPQYPNLFRYPPELKNQIRQRYFRDAATGIVHFVALTVHQSQPSKSNPTQA
jgi:hypothetical protein